MLRNPTLKIIHNRIRFKTKLILTVASVQLPVSFKRIDPHNLNTESRGNYRAGMGCSVQFGAVSFETDLGQVSEGAFLSII
jgi:hypothetical protein